MAHLDAMPDDFGWLRARMCSHPRPLCKFRVVSAQLAARKKDSDLLSSFLWSIGDSKTNNYPLYKPLQECFLLRIFACHVAQLCAKMGYFWDIFNTAETFRNEN